MKTMHRKLFLCLLSLCLSGIVLAQSNVPKQGPLPTLKPLPKPGAKPSAPVVPSDTMKFGDVTVEPGKTVVATLTLPENIAKTLSADYGQPTTIIKAAIAVPVGFNPLKHQRVLIVSASTTGDGLSIKHMKTYTKAALARGWIVMAADGEFGKPKQDHIYFRENMLHQMLAALKKSWPQCQSQWSVATAGFSGGAGYASHQALILASYDWTVIGMLLMNGGYSPAQWGNYLHGKGETAAMRQIPVFYSACLQDNVAKPDLLKVTIQKTKQAGYTNLREQWSDGGHRPTAENIAIALEWFESFDQQS